MSKNETYRAKLDLNGHPILDANGNKIMELVSSFEVPNEPLKFNWMGLTKDLYACSVFVKVIDKIYTVNQIAYTTFLKVLTDESSENTMIYLFGKLELTLSALEKTEINNLFIKNNFTVRIV